MYTWLTRLLPSTEASKEPPAAARNPPPDDELDALRAQAAEGNARAAGVLGSWLSKSPDAARRQEGLFWLRAAAGLGDLTALRWLAGLLHTGWFGERNLAEARTWLERVEATGDPHVLLDLSSYCWNGWGGPRERRRALALIWRAQAREPRKDAEPVHYLARAGWPRFIMLLVLLAVVTLIVILRG